METDMYKKQMILQRVVCYLGLVAAALVFIYSLGLMTGLYENGFAYYAEAYYKDNTVTPQFAGTEVYYKMQSFNQDLTSAGIVMILLAVAQFVFRNHLRRKYYIANYITVVANTIGSVAISVWALNNILSYKAQYLLVDFTDEKLLMYSELFKYNAEPNVFWFDISKVVFGFVFAVTVLNVLNLIFKVIVMNAEKKLLKESKEV